MSFSKKNYEHHSAIKVMVSKTSITLVLAALFSILSFAQQGINYKALIKDNIGNVLANETINVKFSIINEIGNAIKYVEEHENVLTDDNGIIILSIGEGDPEATYIFGEIDWSGAHFLKTEIDIEQNGSFIEVSNTELKTVPYAINAANVNGLQRLNEGNGAIDGWRFRFANPNYYGNIGSRAVDLSIQVTDSERGATGLTSFAGGWLTHAEGEYSTALGFTTHALGESSFAAGVATKAEARNSAVFGRNNIGGGSATNWIATDPLFEIGNGTPSVSSNALTVLKNGTIIAPSFEIANIIDDKALITKEYLDTNKEGIKQVTEDGNTGWRLIGTGGNGSLGTIGNNAIDLSEHNYSNKGATGSYSFVFGQDTYANESYSIAMGRRSEARGYASFAFGNTSEATGSESIAMGYFVDADGERAIAMGELTDATGDNSTAFGNNTTAFGIESFAAGKDTNATGNNSTALGNSTTAIGLNSTSMGIHTIATAYASTAIGKFNAEDPGGLFMVGNGTGQSVANRNNALIIRENGDAQFDGKIQHTSTGSTNLIPVAYGSFDGDDGTDPNDILSGTGNFTVTRAGDFTYTISVNGETLDISTCSASIVVSTDFFRTANVTYSGGDMKVHIFSSTFNKVPAPFQFVIYKN